jgi:hypothetical protein
MKAVDISKLEEENHDYALHLATRQDILSYRNGTFLLNDTTQHTPYEVVDFWRDVSLAAEILLKASLLKHHIPFFKKRANCEYGETVCAKENPWLAQTLEELQITYIAEINTGTVSTALRSAEELLFGKIGFEQDKEKLISEMFYIIIRTRRNRNNHFFFPNQGIMDTGDVEMLYLPLLNLLEELYSL